MEAAKNAIVENEEIMATETAKLHKLEADLVREQENLEKVMESLKGTLFVHFLYPRCTDGYF